MLFSFGIIIVYTNRVTVGIFCDNLLGYWNEEQYCNIRYIILMGPDSRFFGDYIEK